MLRVSLSFNYRVGALMGFVDEPRWLDECEHRAWRALATLLRRLPVALDAQLLGGAGLNLFEYEVMAGLRMSPGRTLGMSALADYAQGSLPRLSPVIARMEERGWIARQRNPSDGRATLVTLTRSGLKKVDSSTPGHVEAVRTYVFDPVSNTQVAQLHSISRRIVDAVELGT